MAVMNDRQIADNPAIATINYVTGGAAARATFGQPEAPLALERLFLCLVTMKDGRIIVGSHVLTEDEVQDVGVGREGAFADAMRQASPEFWPVGPCVAWSG